MAIDHRLRLTGNLNPHSATETVAFMLLRHDVLPDASIHRRACMSYNTHLSGEDAEDQNVIHILIAGASSERMKRSTRLRSLN